MKRWIKDLDTKIRQRISDWAERKGMECENNRKFIKEKFYFWLSWKILGL
jgi:hypothetical protein